MRKLFVEKKCGAAFILSGPEHKHLSIVLRARPGDEVILCPGDGCDYLYRIASIGRDETLLRLITVKEGSMPSVPVTLFMPLLKGDKNELVVQKTVELGIAAIYPYISRYSQLKAESLKPERLNKIIKEACEQCGASKLSVLHAVLAFSEVLPLLQSFSSVIFFYERERELDIKSFLGEDRPALSKDGVAIVVGGEGGFAEDEAAALKAAGAVSVSLGARILRAETACITAAALTLYEYGALK